MVGPVRDHYDKLLGPVYSWMVGDIDAAMIRADAELEAIGLDANGSGVAVDLGAGSFPIRTVDADLLEFQSHVPLPAAIDAPSEATSACQYSAPLN